MRKLLVGVLGLVLVLVVLIVAAVFIPSPLQKWAVERGATMATGRQVTIGGPFSLRAWPPSRRRQSSPPAFRSACRGGGTP